MKKFLSLLLSIILILTIVPAFQVAAANEPTFVVGNAKGEAGDTVKITISTKNNPGIIFLSLEIGYDSNALKLLNHTEGDFTGVTYGPKTKNPFIVTWGDPLKPDNNTNGVIATLEFEVLDTAPNGKSEITVTPRPDNVFNFDMDDVHFKAQNGYVDIKNPNPKKPSSSQQSSSVTASVDSETQEMYEQVIEDMLNDPDNIKIESDDKNSTTANNSEIITDGATNTNDNSTNDDVTNNNNDNKNNNNDNQPTNSWLIWVVIAAMIVLGAAFAVVILKSKNGKH
ncbi:MAG: hypothetical protein IJN56_06805 [Clostridia bacterium]|nr:hypothetical protein [Clostridia bacterium]